MSSSGVVLYQYPRAGRLESVSPFCVKVHLALKYKRLPYEVVDVHNRFLLGRITPRGRLPAADVGGERVVDSSDIVAALERLAPDPPLYPAESLLRARAQVYEDWADEVLYPYVLYWRWLIEPPHPTRAFAFLPIFLRPAAIAYYRHTVQQRLRYQGTGTKPESVVRNEIAAELAALSALLAGAGGPFLLGTAEPTIADIAVFAQIDGLYWKPLPQAMALLERHESIMTWYRAVDERTRGREGLNSPRDTP
ncbi:MAG: glutathione S-transferase family protein [Candidatus Schekmanbacteria bacterium]|nr:glutathione S-transferase family protein [Candidatus Schekmanbacteria bacterium]